jgi:hypothetical protein
MFDVGFHTAKLKRLDDSVVLVDRKAVNHCVDRPCFIAMSLNKDQRRLCADGSRSLKHDLPRQFHQL